MLETLPIRTEKTIRRYAKDRRYTGDTDAQLSILLAICRLCGEASHSRKMLTAIGIRLLQPTLEIIVPTCPDYSHKNGCYTFKKLNGGVSLLTCHHVALLKRLKQVLPEMQVTFLIADLECEDPLLREVVGLSRPEFLGKLSETLTATKEMVSKEGWSAMYMSEKIPDMAIRERDTQKWIEETKKFSDRIHSETISRMPMYQKISSRISTTEGIQRTIRTAAQYVSLGNVAYENGYLVCNHTTVNLSWYNQTKAAVLHNDVSVY